MPPLVTGNTSALVSMALDITALRQQAIAHNIANANTPGYRPVRVGFDAHLAALRQRAASGAAISRADLGAPHPAVEVLAPDALGNDSVALDAEVAKLSENSLQQQALLKLLNRHYAILGSAITEGKK